VFHTYDSVVKHARGKYIVFMDDDDYAKPHQIETLMRVALATSANVVTSGHDVFHGRNYPPGNMDTLSRYIPLGSAKLPGMLQNIFGDSKFLVEKNFFIDLGGFTEDYGVGFEDYEFLARVVLHGHHLEAVPEPLNYYRRHENTMSDNTNLKANQIRFLRAYMEAHAFAPVVQQQLLAHTQKLFFERAGKWNFLSCFPFLFFFVFALHRCHYLFIYFFIY